MIREQSLCPHGLYCRRRLVTEPGNKFTYNHGHVVMVQTRTETQKEGSTEAPLWLATQERSGGCAPP